MESTWLWWFGIVAVAILAAAACGLLAVLMSGKPQRLAECAGSTNEVLRTLVQVFGLGLVLLAAYRGLTSYELQATATKRELLFRASGQLSSQELGPRIGAIYALGTEDAGSTADRARALSVLQGHLRERYELMGPARSDTTDPGWRRSGGIELQALMDTVIGLSQTDELEGPSVDLERLSLVGINLNRRDLRAMSFRGSDLRRAQLREATLARVRFDDPTKPIPVYESHATSKFVASANLGFAVLVGADLRGAVLTGADLNHAHLHEARLADADLTHAVLRCAVLRRADLSGSMLALTDFSSADLGGADLNGALVHNVDMRNAIAIGINLGEASPGSLSINFENARATAVDFRDHHLGSTNLTGTDLRGSDLSRTKGLTQEKLDSACADSSTKLPSGLTLARECKLPLRNDLPGCD